jgi:hypothetical protein
MRLNNSKMRLSYRSELKKRITRLKNNDGIVGIKYDHLWLLPGHRKGSEAIYRRAKKYRIVYQMSC